MKGKFILAALLMTMAGVQSAWAQKMILKMAGQEPVIYKVSQMEYIMFEEANPDEHEWVDLGLPSGTLWATCNIGADKPEDYGSYFAWGETEPKDTYNWSTYFDTEDNGSTFKKYNFNGGLTELLPEDDAATANWGSGWQTPNLSQITELYNRSNTTTTWTTQNGVNGMLITSHRNGKSIFLPAAGSRYNTSLNLAGSYGYYWSRSLYTGNSNYACDLSVKSDDIFWYYDDRYYGQSVRAVRKK